MSELYHHGILGMKWGVRRTPEQLGHRREKREELKNRAVRSSGTRSSSTLKKARKEDINKLSNQQLKEYNERLTLEQNYARLTEGRVKKARDWVGKTLISSIVVAGAVEITKEMVVKPWLKNQFGIRS